MPEARTMYDSTSAADIPADAQMVAGYVDGAYKWSATDWNRFSSATLVKIATQPSTNDGEVLDVELGDASPSEAPAWIRKRQASGLRQPTIYCAAFAVSEIRRVCSGLLYWLWVADWTGQPHPVAYAAAVQYADDRQSGGHYDLSIVYSDQWPEPHAPEVSVMGYMGPGPAATAADQIARRVTIHEWAHMPGANPGADWPAEAAMDRLLSVWVQSGAEAVFATMFGA